MPPKSRGPSRQSSSPSRGITTEMKRMETPQVTRRDPSVLTPTTSAPNAPVPKPIPQFNETAGADLPEESRCTKCKRYMYNKQDKTFCERSCTSWWYMIGYSIMYLIFLCTYTMIFLYGSLELIKMRHNKDETFLDGDIGLSATPTSENIYPLIWYRNGERNDYDKYVNALDDLLTKNQVRSKRQVNNDLGPCGYPPYGYGDRPCIIIRINKQMKWTAKPLHRDSPKAKEAPDQVQKWLQMDKKKFWIHCSGYHAYDREHIGNIRYYPDPPGFDADLFPLNTKSPSPLVAIQVTNFTVGISLAIECKLWYDSGVSTLEFILYVAPKRIMLRNNTSVRM